MLFHPLNVTNWGKKKYRVKLPEYKNIPLVCLSAHAFKKDKENALDAGVDVFLAKPVENHILINAILTSLKKRNSDYKAAF
ncbi:MAG TPA: response regulator [Ignavibacteria bacterium]|nr:response regulator [Ignavibacteria bacterium]